MSAPAITCTGRPFRLNAAVTVASNHVYPSNKIRYLNKTHHNPHPIPLVGAGASWWVEATGPATLANVSSIKQPSTGVYTLELYPFDEGIYYYIVRLDFLFCGEFSSCTSDSQVVTEKLRPFLTREGNVTVQSCDTDKYPNEVHEVDGGRLIHTKKTDMYNHSRSEEVAVALLPNDRVTINTDKKSSARPITYWIHMFGDSLTYNSCEYIAHLNKLTPVDPHFWRKTQSTLFRSSRSNGVLGDHESLILSFTTWTGRVIGQPFSEYNVNISTSYPLSVFFMLRKKLNGHVPNVVFINSGLHMVADYLPSQYAVSLDRFLTVFRERYKGPLLWRTTAATQFHEKSFGKHFKLMKCRFIGRVNVFNDVAQSILRKFNVSRCMVDAWSISMPRRDECGDNRHYLLGKQTFEEVMWSETLRCIQSVI